VTVGGVLLRLATAATLAFIYIPLFIIGLYAFNENITQGWPISGYTTAWFGEAWRDENVRDALWLSVKCGLLATAVALLLGTLASLAVARYRFFGRESISFLIILPIALPGIVTGHATFCIVVVYNNVIARLRRVSANLEEASSDLGADGWQTFRYVTFPQLRTALLAGGLLAFALSFDEVIVTTFTSGAEQTLPIWIFTNLARPEQLPIINVVALAVIVLSVIPVWIAVRLTREPTGVGGTAGAAVGAGQ
jgi:putative spermidine/putrescine transport system permease protein